MSKTVLLIRNAYSYDFGGGERVPVVIASELVKNGYNPIVISRSPKLLAYSFECNIPTIKGWWWARQDWSGIKQIFVPLYFVWQIILFFWYIQIILRTSPDIVHPQSKDDFIAATLAGKILRKKIIWSDYADLKYVYLNNEVWYKNPIGKLIWRLSGLATAILLTSKSDKRLIEESLGQDLPSSYTVVHYGVSSDPVVITPRPKDDNNAVIFASTSRLVVAKGIGELITAFNSISKGRNDLRLWLFGEGPDKDTFKKLAANNQNIIFQGYPDNTLERVADSDVFVHPSYLEGFSISLVEAAKLGLPIIACRVGGNPELVINGENGLLVPAKDPEALAIAMNDLASNTEKRNAFGAKARQDYESRLTFEKIVKEKVIPLYEK